MPRLVHPQHAVHALHRAAGPHHAAQEAAATRRYHSRQFAIELLADHLLHQVGHMPAPTTGPARLPRGRCRRSHHSRTNASRSSVGDRQRLQLRVQPVQEREALRGLQVVDRPDPRPDPASAGRAAATRASAQARSLSRPSGRNTAKAASACFQAASIAS